MQNSVNDFNVVHILVVEDNEHNYFYIKAILNSHSYQVLHARDGEEAMAILHSTPEISLVLLDIQLPKINGIEVMRNIKKFRPEIPVFAITAFAMSGDQERFLSIGFDEYISKPFKPEALYSLLEEYL